MVSLCAEAPAVHEAHTHVSRIQLHSNSDVALDLLKRHSGIVWDPVMILLSLLSTRLTSHTVPPIVVTKDPLEWTGDPEARTNRVLPSERKGWACKACGDMAVCATQDPP